MWQPTQNVDAFNIVAPMIDSQDLAIEHMGVLEHGAVAYMLCRLMCPKMEVGTEEIRAYLLVANHHDGETSIRFTFMPIRVRGNTTLSIRNRTDQRIFRVKHSGVSAARIADVGMTMELMKISFNETVDLYERMDKYSVKDGELNPYITQVFDLPDETLLGDSDIHRSIERILLSTPKRTLWNVYCAISEYVNYNIGTYTQSRRIFRLWMGTNSRLLQRAIDFSQRILNNG